MFYVFVFWRLHYQSQSWCRLPTLELQFNTVGLLFMRCRQRWVLHQQARDNIREAIGVIQLHTIDNMLKNWTDRVGYCMASWSSHLNYFPLLTGRIVSNKKRNLRKYSVVFFKAFSKKKCIWRTLYKINTHNICMCHNPDWRVVTTNCICMYVIMLLISISVFQAEIYVL